MTMSIEVLPVRSHGESLEMNKSIDDEIIRRVALSLGFLDLVVYLSPMQLGDLVVQTFDDLFLHFV